MRILQENNTNILILDADLQGAEIEKLEDTLESLKDNSVGRVALDMSNVGYIYSKGIGTLVRAQKDLQARGTGLFLYNLNHTLRKILMEINLLDFLNGYDSKEEMEFDFLQAEPSDNEASLELGLFVEGSAITENKATFKLTGTIDSESDLEYLMSECDNKINQGCVHIIFNLTDLIYIDDKGIYKWKNLGDRLKEKQGSLTLQSMNEIILDQLKIMNYQHQFKIE